MSQSVGAHDTQDALRAILYRQVNKISNENGKNAQSRVGRYLYCALPTLVFTPLLSTNHALRDDQDDKSSSNEDLKAEQKINIPKSQNTIIKKETPGALRKEQQRLEDSRDNLREKNFKKSIRIKALSGKIDDLLVSRDLWKKRNDDNENKIAQLNVSVKQLEEKLRCEEELSKRWEELADIERQRRAEEVNARDKQIEELKKKL